MIMEMIQFSQSVRAVSHVPMKFGFTEMFSLPAPAERNGRSYAYAGADSSASHRIKMENGPAAAGIAYRGGWSSGAFRRLPCAAVLRRILPRLWHDARLPIPDTIGFSGGLCLSSAGLRACACCALYSFSGGPSVFSKPKNGDSVFGCIFAGFGARVLLPDVYFPCGGVGSGLFKLRSLSNHFFFKETGRRCFPLFGNAMAGQRITISDGSAQEKTARIIKETAWSIALRAVSVGISFRNISLLCLLF